MEKRFENFTGSVIRLYRLIQRIKVHVMRGYGLKGIHVMCIYYLNEHPSGLCAGELMRYTVEDKGALSRALAELKARGFIIYGDGKYNAVITLTDTGKQLAEYITEQSDRAVRAGSAHLSDTERNIFYSALTEISANLEKYYLDLTETSG